MREALGMPEVPLEKLSSVQDVLTGMGPCLLTFLKHKYYILLWNIYIIDTLFCHTHHLIIFNLYEKKLIDKLLEMVETGGVQQVERGVVELAELRAASAEEEAEVGGEMRATGIQLINRKSWLLGNQ